MTTIGDKLQLTLSTKNAIKQALIDKGAAPGDEFSTYPAYIINLSGRGIAKPSIISPIDGATGVSIYPIVTGSGYGGITENGPDPHQDSLWEFSSDADFSNILHTSGWTSQNLESYELDMETPFELGSLIFARVTYRGQSGESNTSDVVSFEISETGAGSVVDGDIIAGQINGYWLLVSPANLRAQRQWGSYGTDTALPNYSGSDPNSGQYNTSVLVNRGSGRHPAAEYCHNLGYHLPNVDEMRLIVDNKEEIDAADTSGGTNILASLSNAWTSTEHSSTHARYHRPSDNFQFASIKSADAWVVPVRSIPV